jgi:glycosyltransferase involved in cell wall biosynthesis
MVTVAVIAAYNEEKTVKRILEGTARYVDAVIVVDDGSTDRTYDEIKNTTAHIIRHNENRGIGASLRNGVSEAIQIGADFVVVLDADGEHDPEDIPKLLNVAKLENVDIVIGSRFLDKSGAYKMPLVKRASNKISTFLLRILYRMRTTDSQSGFRVYRKRVFQTIQCTENNMLYPTEVLIVSTERGFSVTEVPIVSISTGRKIGNHRVKEIFLYPLLLLKFFRKNSSPKAYVANKKMTANN